MSKIFKKSSGITKEWVGFLKAPTPGSGTKKFIIVKRKLTENGSINQTVKSETLNAINAQYLSGKLTFEQAKTHVKNIVDQINQKIAVQFNQENLDLVKRYWNEDYQYRDLVDHRSAYNRLVRAVEAIGHYSLLSATPQEIQSEVDKLKGNKQRAVVSALKQILKFLGREIKLRRAREQLPEVTYITETELPKLVAQIKIPEIKLMHEVAFATGLRAGELFGLLPHHIKGDVIDVSTQIDVQCTRREIKNRKPHKAYILPRFEEKVAEWASIPLEQRLAFRKRSLAKLTRLASRKALGREITFHALRHSYAIHLISKGASLTIVSNLIGDSIKVTERYYAGHISTPEQIQLLKVQIKT